MTNTYVTEDFNADETRVFKQIGQNATNTRNQDTFSNVYAESTTDVYEEPIVTIRTTVRSEQALETANSVDKRRKIFLNKQHTMILIGVSVCTVVILAVLALVFGILNFTEKQFQNEDEEAYQTPQTTLNTTEYVTTKPLLGTFPNPARSCVELRDTGLNDGVYVIQPSLKPFEVYCDMTAAGGGWILAATINDNDLSLEESYSDLWFVKSSNNFDNVTDYQNWMNTNTFGTFATCTRTDFKSQAYYEYQGKDIMLRHVPSQTPLEASREQSLLQYHTENGFMQIYGGNLHGILNFRYPLKPENVFYPDVNSMMDRLDAKDTEITNLITDFYLYNYGTHAYRLEDINLFGNDYGMQIYLNPSQSCYPYDYEANCQTGYLDYGLDFGCDLGNMMRSSRIMHPFFALFAVGNFDHCFDYFYMEVFSFRPDTDSIVPYKGNHTLNNFFLHYEAQCRNGSSYASLCDVWFYVINTENWKSSETPAIELYNYTYTTFYFFEWRIREAVSNTLFGYTMLSRKYDVLIADTEINAVMHKILEIISETNKFCPDCFYDDDVLSVPVQFSIGNDSVVNSLLPPSVKPLPTGFVQFRAYGRHGSIYAMCPAVKVNDWRSEFVCIGGMNNPEYANFDDCNDFTNWDGLPNTLLNETTPVDYAHSQRDLDSTIMIFYR